MRNLSYVFHDAGRSCAWPCRPSPRAAMLRRRTGSPSPPDSPWRSLPPSAAWRKPRRTAAAAEGLARNPAARPGIQLALILGLALIESLALYTLVIIFAKVK